MIRLVIADDHELILKGFQLMLSRQNDIQLVADASNGRDLIDIVAQHRPDIVITDIQMPVMDGIEACRRIKESFTTTEVLALSTFGDDHFVIEMLEAGARGYLLKNSDREDLIEAITTVYNGDVYFSRS